MTTKRPLRALVVAPGLVAVAAAPAFLVGSLAPEIGREFSFGTFELGASVASFFIVSSAVSPAAGGLVHRLGARAGVRLTLALAIACPAGVVLLAHSTPGLIAVLAVGALANAGSGPAASMLLTRHLPAGRQGLGYGTLAAGAPGAALIAGLALPLIADPLGWRTGFALVVVLSALVGVLATTLVDERTPASGTAVPAPRRSGRWNRWGKPHTLAVAAALGNSGATGMTAFLVVYAIDAGLSTSAAGLLLAAVSLTATTSRVSFGLLADRVGPRSETYLIVIFALSSLGFVLLIAETATAIVVGALIAGGLGWGWGGLINLAAVRGSDSSPSEAVGIALTGVFVGAFVGPLATGAIADGFGFAAAWIVAAGMQLGAAVAATVARGSPARTGRAVEPPLVGGARADDGNI